VKDIAARIVSFFKKHIRFFRKREERAFAQSLLDKLSSASADKNGVQSQPSSAEHGIEKRS